MDTKTYLNKNYFDTQRGKHRAIDVIKCEDNNILLKTEEGKMLKIKNDIENNIQYKERFEWLEQLNKKEFISDFVALPEKVLTGLKYNECGYISELGNEVDLNYYIHPSKGEKLFKWYYDKTGGIEYRLKIGYGIALTLEKIHNQGYCIVDINPRNTTLTRYEQNGKRIPDIKFICMENICSYTHHPSVIENNMYTDPLVYLNRTTNSVAADVYSYAIMLFELLTLCHPFVGEECEDLSEYETIERINRGALDYIDDLSIDNNKNEDYEDTQLFVPDELKILFYRMFTEGKLDARKRPTLSEFKNVCLKALQKYIKCTHNGCGRDYPYNKARRCPFCNYVTEDIVSVKVRKIISSSKEILLPYGNNDKFTALSPIEECVGEMILKPGINKVTKSFFDKSLGLNSGETGIWIQYSLEKGKIALRNRFENIKIKTNKKILEPYSKDAPPSKSDCVFPIGTQITIELPDNILLDNEEVMEFITKEYGEIKYRWVLTIE